ncbi:hypothetical protein DL93DRAFT_2222838 [Clavulina sp. PMI_390]|nr:hypothetical protein DL93DRAFT_2222838 [Clavulina sp. PMI_390]
MRTTIPMTLSRFVGLSCLLSVARALTLNWPATVTFNAPATIVWAGQQPFFFAVYTVDNSTGVETQVFQLLQTNATTTQWDATVPVDTTVLFYVSDNTGKFVSSTPVVVAPAGGFTSSSTGQISATAGTSTTAPPSSSTVSTTTFTSASTSSGGYVQPSMSQDHTIPVIVGVICSIVGLVIIAVAIRFFLKRRRRLQIQAASAASRMRYWPTSDSKPAAAPAPTYDVEKSAGFGKVQFALPKEQDAPRRSSSGSSSQPSDRASASSEDQLMANSKNVPSSALAPPAAAVLSPPRTSPMLPPASLPNPFSDANRAMPPPAQEVEGSSIIRGHHNGTMRSEASRETVLANARASSIFMPLNDEAEESYEDVDLNAPPIPSTSRVGPTAPTTSTAPSAFAYPPTSWKSTFPPPVPSIPSDSDLQAFPSTVTRSREGSLGMPASPSPFDDVVFDLGALPSTSVGANGLGRSTSTKTTHGVRKHAGAPRERTGSNASRVPASAPAATTTGAGYGLRSPPADFPRDADEDDDFDLESRRPSAFEHTRMSTVSTGAWSSVTGTSFASSQMTTPPPVPPVPPLNIAKLQGLKGGLQPPTAPAPAPAQAASGTAATPTRKSIIPSPSTSFLNLSINTDVNPSTSESSASSYPVTSLLQDSPILPLTGQSDGEFVRHMMGGMFSSTENDGSTTGNRTPFTASSRLNFGDGTLFMAGMMVPELPSAAENQKTPLGSRKEKSSGTRSASPPNAQRSGKGNNWI